MDTSYELTPTNSPSFRSRLDKTRPIFSSILPAFALFPQARCSLISSEAATATFRSESAGATMLGSIIAIEYRGPDLIRLALSLLIAGGPPLRHIIVLKGSGSQYFYIG